MDRVLKHFHWSLLFFSFLCIQLNVFAQDLSIWRHNPPNNPSLTRSGALLDGETITYASPAIADLDNNLENGLETAIATSDGILNVVRADGSLIWTAKLPNYSCSKAPSDDKVFASPVIGDLYGNGEKYIIVAYGGLNSLACGGGLVAYNGLTGKRKWRFNLKRFSKKEKFPVPIGHGILGTPALGDIDGDGQLEIGFGSIDRHVYILNSNGKPMWYYHTADTVWSSGVFANINNKGPLEFVIGTDITRNDQMIPKTKDGGFIYAFKIKIRKAKKLLRKKSLLKYEFREKGSFFWQTYVDQTIYSSPAIAEMIPENPGLELVIGSGCFFPENTNNKNGKWLKILSLRTGKVLNTLNAPNCVPSNPFTLDIDGDGISEVFVAVPGNKNIGGDGRSKVVAWKTNNSNPIWTTIPYDKTINDSYAGYLSSLTVADLDGDGKFEVITPNGFGIVILDAHTGEQLTCGQTCDDYSIRLSTGKILRGTPKIIDINNDSKFEIVIAGGRDYDTPRGVLYGWQHLYFFR